MLDLQAVTKAFPQSGTVLDGVDLRIEAGDMLAIVGPSGSGKSTLLHLIGGLDQPTTGCVRFDGTDLSTMTEPQLAAFRNQSVGFIFQSHFLLPQCTALENVLIPTLAQPDRADDAVGRARELLEQVGLADRLNHRPGALSGGQCQRVAVARALINQPRVLLADEPTGSLDGRLAESLIDMLVSICRERHVALAIVTHAMDIAGRMNRVMTLSQGRLIDATDVTTGTAS